MSKKIKLSLIMITKNSSKLLNKSLSSVKGLVDEIIIIDDYSVDNTREIAKKFGSKIYKRHNDNFGKQKAYALSKAKGDWILCLDSDEVVSLKLKLEIQNILSKIIKHDGYFIPYKNHIFGKLIRQKGEKQKCLRLFKKSSIYIKPNIVHEHFELKKGKSRGLLNYSIYHFSYRSIFQVIKKFTDYAKREAKRKIIKKEQITLKKLVLYPLHMFWARCIKDKGYKDGVYRIFLDLAYAYMEFFTYFILLKSRLFKSKFLINFLSFNISSLFIKLLALFLFIFLIKYLDPSEYGVYALVWAHITLLSPFMDFGTTYYGIIHLNKHRQDKFSMLFSLRFFLSFIVFVLTIVLGAVFFKNNPIIVLYIFLTSFAIISSMMSGSFLIWNSLKERIYVSSIISLIFNAVLTILLIVVLITKKTLSPIFYTISIMYILYTFTVFLFLKKKVGKIKLKFDIKAWKSVIQRSYVFVCIAFFSGLYFKIDVYLLKFLKSEQDVGIYSAGYKFFEALLFIIMAYNVSAIPIFKKLIKQSKQALINKMKKDMLFLFIIGITISLLTYLLFPYFLPLIAKKAYISSIQVLQITIFALPFLLINSVFLNALYVLNKAYLVIFVFIFQTVFNLSLNYILIPRYSYIACSYITVIAEIINIVIFYLIIKKVIKKYEYIR